MGTFYRPQYAEDWGFLNHSCLPTNLDGLTERHGHFLLVEVKRGEGISEGQRIMLERLAKLPNWTVIVLNSRVVSPDEMNARPVEPWYYRRLDETGELRDPVFTTPDDFRDRYSRWFVTQRSDSF